MDDSPQQNQFCAGDRKIIRIFYVEKTTEK